MNILNIIGYGIIAAVIIACITVAVAAWLHGTPRKCMLCDEGKIKSGKCPICGGEGVIK